MKAVIDRFEGDVAVLLLGDEALKLDVPRTLLPKDAGEGSWLQVELQDGKLLSAVLDAEETQNRKQRIADKLERLRNKGKPGK